MKYYIAEVTEMINGFETSKIVLVEAMQEQSALKKLYKIMKTWRGDGDDSYEDESASRKKYPRQTISY